MCLVLAGKFALFQTMVCGANELLKSGRSGLVKITMAWLLLACVPLHAETLRLVERAETDATHVRGGTAADNVGDILTFVNPIFDAANTVRSGSDQGFCVRLVVGKTYECHLTLLLGSGEIVVDGPFYDTADSLLAVTGGTGAYAGARGEMKLHARDGHGSAFYDFGFDLLRR